MTLLHFRPSLKTKKYVWMNFFLRWNITCCAPQRSKYICYIHKIQTVNFGESLQSLDKGSNYPDDFFTPYQQKKEHLWVLSGRNIGYSTSWNLVNLFDSSRAEISRRRPIVSWQMARWFATIWSSIFTTQCSLLQILLTKKTQIGFYFHHVMSRDRCFCGKRALTTKIYF